MDCGLKRLFHEDVGDAGFEDLIEFGRREVGKGADMEADAFGQLGRRHRGLFHLITNDRIDVLAVA